MESAGVKKQKSSLPDSVRKAIKRDVRAAAVLRRERQQRKKKPDLIHVGKKDIVGGIKGNQLQIQQERVRNGNEFQLNGASPSNVNELTVQCSDKSLSLIGEEKVETTPKKFKPRYSKLTTFDDYINIWREHVREAQLEKMAIPPDPPEVVRQKRLEEEQYRHNIEQFMKKCYDRSVDDPYKTVWVGGRIVLFEEEARKNAQKESQNNPDELALGERLQLYETNDGDTDKTTFDQSTYEYMPETSQEGSALKPWEGQASASTFQNAFKYDPGYVSHGELIIE